MELAKELTPWRHEQDIRIHAAKLIKGLVLGYTPIALARILGQDPLLYHNRMFDEVVDIYMADYTGPMEINS